MIKESLDDAMNFMGDYVLPLVMIVLLVLLVLFPFACLFGTKPEKIMLDANNWDCKKTQSFTTSVLVGKVMIPQTRTRCVLWGEKQ